MRLYCNRVEIFFILVSFIGIGLYIGQLGRALQTLPQQESHHLKLVGAGVVERTVVHSTALYIYVSRPAVAGVVFIASPHRVQCFHVDGLAEAVVQNVLFQSQYIAGVVKLIPYRNELTGLLFQLFQRVNKFCVNHFFQLSLRAPSTEVQTGFSVSTFDPCVRQVTICE